MSLALFFHQFWSTRVSFGRYFGRQGRDGSSLGGVRVGGREFDEDPLRPTWHRVQVVPGSWIP